MSKSNLPVFICMSHVPVLLCLIVNHIPSKFLWRCILFTESDFVILARTIVLKVVVVLALVGAKFCCQVVALIACGNIAFVVYVLRLVFFERTLDVVVRRGHTVRCPLK